MLELNETLSAPAIAKTKSETGLQSNNTRITSIDILRALTMLLMIFVNDLWSLKNIPAWLEHVAAKDDGMGLADTVFPAFLFIVGMAIPYAIDNRRKKGDNTIELVKHIVMRSIALLVMGVFLVNGENINATATGMSRGLWNTLSCLSFILIWNAYSKTINPTIKRTLQGVGIAALITLALLYRGDEAGQLKTFSTYWWGILGLIGWCYLTASLITTFAKSKTVFIVAAWFAFTVLSMVSSAGLLPKDGLIRVIPSPIMGGTLVALSLGGVLTTKIFQHYSKHNAYKPLMLTLVFIAAGLILLGLYTNTFWDISKIRATAPWLFLCSAFTILAFIVVYWLADINGKAKWFDLIKPAGTNTLLCYLIPYFAYAIVRAIGMSLPEVLLTGPVGLLKSFVFALLCIWMAGMLVKKGIRLKL